MTIVNLPWVLFWLGAGLCWWLFMFPVRDLRIDETRQRLFNIRNSMFDEALKRGHQNSKAHKLVRFVINGMIRFAHDMSLFEMLTYRVLGRSKAPEMVEARARYQRDLEKAISALPKEDRIVFLWAISAAHKVVLLHILKTSPILFPIFSILWVARRLEPLVQLKGKLLKSIPSREFDAFAYAEGRRNASAIT